MSQVHTTYLWHLEQPIYWPEQSQWEPNHMQYAWESQWLKWNNGNWYNDGKQHPLNNIQEIFSNEDRKAVYQYRAKDAVQSLLGYPEAGAQVNYSGCLIYNVNSLASAGQWGYSNGWQNNFITARGWTTTGENPAWILLALLCIMPWPHCLVIGFSANSCRHINTYTALLLATIRYIRRDTGRLNVLSVSGI